MKRTGFETTPHFARTSFYSFQKWVHGMFTEVVSNNLKENGLLSDLDHGEVHSFVTDSKESFEKIVTRSLSPIFDIAISSTNRIDIN